jgi:hypothetical protein
MANEYIFLFSKYIIKTSPGYISLGALESSVANFYFEIPVFHGDYFIYFLGKKLFEFIASEEDAQSLKCGARVFKLVRNEDKTITMSLDQSTYTFEDEYHSLSFIKSIPIMACQAAVSRRLFRPLVDFCSRLYKTETNAGIFLKSEHQFALASTALWKLFPADEKNDIKEDILVFTEINYQFISSVIEIQKVINKCLKTDTGNKT